VESGAKRTLILNQDGPDVWIISESGMNTLILRCDDAMEAAKVIAAAIRESILNSPRA
jgi:prophage antirepressor-like protein